MLGSSWLSRPGAWARIVPFLALLLGNVAFADDGPPAAAADAQVDEGPPATVLEDRLEVKIDSAGRLVEKRTWKVRIDDPARCRAGLVAPDGLDGARDGVAQVFERLLVPPDATAPGAVFTLVGTRTRTASAHSGVFATAPDLPVVAASVTITSAQPNLGVWTDSRGRAVFSRSGGRTATISWEGLDTGMSGQVVWTTWKDWLQAGDRMEDALTGKVATQKDQLGQKLAADIQSLSVASAAERVYDLVKYDEGGDERWEASRKIQTILDAKHGTAVDRAVVLISVLRVAGFDARPAMFRPASESGTAPLSVPAPALLERPAVAVYLPGRTVWIDTSSERVAIPETPASMVGSVVWVAGDSPFALPSPGVVDGNVAINAQMNVAPDGSATFTANITAGGTGLEGLRDLLAPVAKADREAALRRLVAVGAPGLDRFGLDASGIDDPYRPLQITIQGHIPDAFAVFGTSGVTGVVHPLIAPALAAWIPPRISVNEDLAITAPVGLLPVATTPDVESFNPDVSLARTFVREGSRISLRTSAERPSRVVTPAREVAAETFLHGAADDGPTVLILPPPTPDVVKSIRGAAGRPPNEVAVLEALLWWTNNNQPKKAEKSLHRAITLTPPGELAPILNRLVARDEMRPWLYLWTEARDDRERVQVISGLVDHGHVREGWTDAFDLLATATDPEARVSALLWCLQLQGDKPDPSDADATRLWREPKNLLAEAEKAAASLPNARPDGDPRVLLAQARVAVAEKRDIDAEGLLERALAAGPDPRASVLLAEVGTRTGVAVEDVVERVDAAVASAPFDPEVVSGAADAMAGVGLRDRALDLALSSARLSATDATAWYRASQYALADGDLGIALPAARRASDLDPASKEYGGLLAMVATLASDQEGAMLGGSRGGTVPSVKWPPSVDELVGVAPDNALLALLQYHDIEVVQSPQNLSLRAQLRLDAGMLDGAARDGALLAARHGNPRGTAIAFAATAGRLWSSGSLDALDVAAKSDAVAYATRLEWHLVSGTGDVAAEAKAQKGDPRSQIIVRAATAPDALAKEVPGFNGEAAEPTVRAPSSAFKPNKVLGGAKGVVAWSDPERARSVVISAQPTGSLPPPLALLYTPAIPALRRLSGGGQLIRLDGGSIPLYAAVRIVDGLEYTAIACTPESALDLLLLSTP